MFKKHGLTSVAMMQLFATFNNLYSQPEFSRN